MEKQKLFLIIIISLLVVLLGSVGFVSFYGFRLLSALGTPQEEIKTENVGKLKLEQIEKVPLSSEITTNLSPSDNGSEHYVKIQLAVGVNNTDKKESSEILESLVSNETVTRDIVLGILHGQTYEDLRLPEGQDLLKESIKMRLQEEYGTDLIAQVYISDLVLS
jgi:flagellar basal body-associated protein FliL